MVLSNLACVSHGAIMGLPSPAFNAEQVLCTVDQERCTALHGVPTIFIAELSHPSFDDYRYDTLRTGIMAGSPCPIEVMREVSARMHMSEVVIVYGQTETSPGITMTSVRDPIERRVTTVERTFSHAETKIIDPNTGTVVPFGEVGEICARDYMVMKGYYNNPSATHTTIDINGWNHTGDLGTMDREGYVKIVGKLKDMVIRGGENIYPREIEEFLHTHPRISDVYVNGDVLTAEGIKDFCRNRIAHYKIPRYIKFVEEFPMSVSGKIQKYKMREISIAELGLEDVSRIETA
jgi:fatty-acyl-CoA synthase